MKRKSADDGSPRDCRCEKGARTFGPEYVSCTAAICRHRLIEQPSNISTADDKDCHNRENKENVPPMFCLESSSTDVEDVADGGSWYSNVESCDSAGRSIYWDKPGSSQELAGGREFQAKSNDDDVLEESGSEENDGPNEQDVIVMTTTEILEWCEAILAEHAKKGGVIPLEITIRRLPAEEVLNGNHIVIWDDRWNSVPQTSPSDDGTESTVE